MTIPCVAIHGVGSQKSQVIEEQVTDTIRRTRFRDTVSVKEFNWDKFVEHSSQRGVKDMIWYLEAIAENISVSARLGLLNDNSLVQRMMGFCQYHLHRICQWIIALAIGLIAAGTIAPLVMSIPNLLFGLPTSYHLVLSWVPSAITYFIYAVLILTGIFFAIGIIQALVAGSLRPFTVTIRSIFLLYFQPVLVFLSGMLSIKWTSVTMPIWLFGGFILLVSMFEYGATLLNGEPFLYGSTLKYTALVLLAASVLVLLQLRFARSWFGTIVKVLLDIFRYLGDPKYRKRVQQNLDETLMELRRIHGPETPVIILSHSLGSIIAIDSLLHSTFWKQDDSVYLITMGSPIRRLFQRFFPNILFPDSIATLAQSAASRVSKLYWINVYRHFDYIGTSLGLSRNGIGSDISTGQKSRLLSSHTDYWSDGGGNNVSSTIDSALEGLLPVKISGQDAQHTPYIIPDPPKRALLIELLKGAGGLAAIGLFLIIFAGSLSWVSSSLEDRNSQLAELALQLRSEGIEVLATVHYNRETEYYDKSSTYIHYFNIEYTDPVTSEARDEEFEFDQSTVHPAHRELFDESVLAKHIRSNCPDPWWKFWKWTSRGIPCSAQNVRFRFLAENPKVYDFPDFLPTEDSRDSKANWFKTAFVTLFVAIFALFPLALAGALFMLLLGHAPFGRPAPK